VTVKFPVFALFAALGFLTGCASYNVGSKDEAEPNGSYAGETLNPSVSDQNPHVGGDASFPSGDVTTDHPPPDKLDGR
jgi:hypothetical protein